MYKLNDVLLSDYGIIPARVKGEGIAVKGIFDCPERIEQTHFDWGDEDSVEPYVDPDELFFGGRDLEFAGIILGTRPEVEAQLRTLKNDIDAFYDRVIFETPYGNYCVYVKDIIPKFYKNGATLTIKFREPDITSDCLSGGNPIPPPTIYYSEDFSLTVRKNDCETGYTGSEYTLYANQSASFPWQSTLSQGAANQLAIDWVYDKVHIFANNNGTCTPNPVTYWNQKITGTLQKNDCVLPSIGSVVEYTVEADKYSSQVSQAAANQLAQDEIDANLTQAYANANGTCSQGPSFTKVYNQGFGSGCSGYRIEKFLCGPTVNANSVYTLVVYSHGVTYTAQAGDTPADVIQGLVNAVNNTTTSQWNDHNSVFAGGCNGFPPTAVVDTYNSAIIVITLNHQNQFAGWVT